MSLVGWYWYGIATKSDADIAEVACLSSRTVHCKSWLYTSLSPEDVTRRETSRICVRMFSTPESAGFVAAVSAFSCRLRTRRPGGSDVDEDEEDHGKSHDESAHPESAAVPSLPPLLRSDDSVRLASLLVRRSPA